MKIAVGSDEKTETTDFVVEYLKKNGYQVKLFGALIKPKVLWSQVAWEVAEAVKDGKVKEGILMCWTGTGVAMAANKVPGIRAVTVTDAKTTEGARKWNHANILCFSCFLKPAVVKKILDTWFSTPYSQDKEDLEGIKKLKEVEKKYLK